MAVVFRDGCDSYGVTADIARKWQSNTGWVYHATAGRNGGGCLQSVSGTGIIKSIFGSMNGSEYCYGYWIKCSTTPAAEIDHLNLYTTGDAIGGKIRLGTGGGFHLTNSANTSTSVTSSNNICDNNWHWIEIRFKTTGTNTISIYDNTSLVLNAVTGNISTSTDHISFTGSANATMTLDDIMVFDDVVGGPVLSSHPLGPRQITTGRPDGDSAITFVPSTGSLNYALVDEQTFDSADYVESGTTGDQDLYDYAAIATTIASITDVGLNSVLVNPNPGTINFQNACKSGGNTTLGTSTITPTTSYVTRQTSYGVDPATSAAWANIAAINSAQFGIKVV